MSSIEKEILQLEEHLCEAELGPDPEFFQTHLDDDMVLMADGKLCSPKPMIVENHKPGKGQKFDKVEMSEMKIRDQGGAAIVTCKGEYEGPAGKFGMEFMRVWVKKPEGWKVVAGAMNMLHNTTGKT